MVCGIFAEEIKRVIQDLTTPPSMIVMPPALCLHPEKLKKELKKVLEKTENSKIVVYGKCFPGIDDVCSQYAAYRIAGETCAEIVGGERVYQLLKEEPGTYFLLPTFCRQFEELTKELDLEKTKEIFFKNYNRCVFLDTGKNSNTCKKIAEQLGLSYHREVVGVSVLEKRLKNLLNTLI